MRQRWDSYCSTEYAALMLRGIMRSQKAPHYLEEAAMPRIGLRDLKIHVSEVVKDVQETGERYTITNRGVPVAMVVPYERGEETRALSRQEMTARLDELAKEIGARWKDPRPVAEVSDELRR